MTDPVDLSVDGHIAVITLRRPEARNAIDGRTAAAIESTLDYVENTESIWVGVLAAEGPVFCAGADLKAIAAGQHASLFTARGAFAGIVARRRDKPLIAAVDGAALAGGAEIVLACDLTVASTRASFGLPEVTRSLIPSSGGLFRLARQIPPRIAMEVALTGKPLSASQAHRLGMVNVLTPPSEALAAAKELARTICANAPLAVRAARDVMLRTIHACDDEAFRISEQAMASLQETNDYLEGPRAFLEKRSPEWRGT